MAKLFLVKIGNFLDDTSYCVPVITCDSDDEKAVQSAIDCKYVLPKFNKDEEYIVYINQPKINYVAFIEDDFRCIEQTLKEFKVIK